MGEKNKDNSKERLEELDLLFMVKGWPQRGQRLSHHKEAHGQDRLDQARFHLERMNKLFTVRTTNHWDNFPRDVAESLSPEAFNLWLDRVLNGLIKAPFPRKGWTR